MSYESQERERVSFYKRVLGDKRYAERHKFPKWNIAPTVLQEPRLFPKVFPELTKAEHVRLAERFENRAKRISTQHHRAVDRGERAYGAHGSLISGGFREQWPESAKDSIRRLAYASSLLKEAAHAHKAAARLRTVQRDPRSHASRFGKRAEDRTWRVRDKLTRHRYFFDTKSEAAAFVDSVSTSDITGEPLARWRKRFVVEKNTRGR